MQRTLILATGLLAGTFAGLAAQSPDSAAFIIRLGTDTTAIERYVRTGDRVEVTGLTRSPTTVIRRYTLWLTPDGGVSRMRVQPATGAATERTLEGGAIPLMGGSYVPWELVLMRARRAGADSTVVTVMNGNNPRPTPVRRVASGEFTLPNQFDALMRARVDNQGRLVSLDAGGGNTVERVRWIDFDGLASAFAARDAAGRGMGPLSPRDSTRATIGPATVVVAYGRPSLRGRELALLAPSGQVWRTGANDATTLRTTEPLRIGNIAVPAGTWSLFTIPGERSWTLILNRQTGQSGLDYDQAQDLGRADMPVRTLSSPVEQLTILVEPDQAGGVLRLRWGRTEVSVPIRAGR